MDLEVLCLCCFWVNLFFTKLQEMRQTKPDLETPSPEPQCLNLRARFLIPTAQTAAHNPKPHSPLDYKSRLCYQAKPLSLEPCKDFEWTPGMIDARPASLPWQWRRAEGSHEASRIGPLGLKASGFCASRSRVHCGSSWSLKDVESQDKKDSEGYGAIESRTRPSSSLDSSLSRLALRSL